MQKRIFIGLVALMTVGSLAFVINKGIGSGQSSVAGNPRPIPYTAVLKETVTSPKGTYDVTELTYAYRSDGSNLRKAIDLKADKSFSERVIQFASGDEVSVNDLTNLKSTIFKRGIAALAQRNSQGDCLTMLSGKPASTEEKLLGKEYYRGYRVARTQLSGAEFLYALDFGCAHVYDRIVFNQNESSEHNLVTLIPGEPDASLFEVSSDVREVTPSERLLSSMKDKSRCGPESNCGSTLKSIDEDYNRSKSRSAK
jgi:hypothetical protein